MKVYSVILPTYIAVNIVVYMLQDLHNNYACDEFFTQSTVDSTRGSTIKLAKPHILSARGAIFFQTVGYNKHLELTV